MTFLMSPSIAACSPLTVPEISHKNQIEQAKQEDRNKTSFFCLKDAGGMFGSLQTLPLSLTVIVFGWSLHEEIPWGLLLKTKKRVRVIERHCQATSL